MTDISPAPGQVWASRYTTGLHVAITEAHGDRVRIDNATVSPQGAVSLSRGTSRFATGRWVNTRQLTRAYRLTEHRLEVR